MIIHFEEDFTYFKYYIPLLISFSAKEKNNKNNSFPILQIKNQIKYLHNNSYTLKKEVRIKFKKCLRFRKNELFKRI